MGVRTTCKHQTCRGNSSVSVEVHMCDTHTEENYKIRISCVEVRKLGSNTLVVRWQSLLICFFVPFYIYSLYFMNICLNI